MITAFFLAILAIVLGFVASILPTVAFPSAITTSISLIMGYINSFSFLFPVSTLLSVVVIAFSFCLEHSGLLMLVSIFCATYAVIDMKVVFSGLESSGKSLKLAMVAVEIAYRNARWKEASGISRPLVSNMRFAPSFEKHVQEDLGLKIIYWQNLSELIKMRDCDIFIDELGTYFDSRLWAELSLDVRRWLSQGAKAGIEMYGAAQDFAQVDKAFRRLVWHLFLIRKIVGSRRPSATKPPVNFIWGACTISELDPQGYDENKKTFKSESIIPRMFFIRRALCEVFFTGQVLERSKGDPLQHNERQCLACGIMKVSHV